MSDQSNNPAVNLNDDEMAKKLMEELKLQGVDIQKFTETNAAPAPKPLSPSKSNPKLDFKLPSFKPDATKQTTLAPPQKAPLSSSTPILPSSSQGLAHAIDEQLQHKDDKLVIEVPRIILFGLIIFLLIGAGLVLMTLFWR